MGKKLLSVLLTICLLASLLPTFCLPALAADYITVGTGGDYDNLSSALTNAGNGDNIKLLESIEDSALISVPAGVTVTVDGGGYTVTAPDATDADSYALSLTGSGTVILRNITLQGGTVTGSTSSSIGLEAYSGSVNILSTGDVHAIGGPSAYNSIGLNCMGTGTVEVDEAIGGTSTTTTDQTGSIGVNNKGTGTVNVYSATGGSSTYGSVGVNNLSTGTVNVTYASSTAGSTASYGDGVDNMGGGNVNVSQSTAASGTSTTSYAIDNESGTVNANTASGATLGIVNTSVSTLTLNKGSSVTCVLDSITIAASGSTQVGTLPSAMIDGQHSGVWYTDSTLTSQFSGTTVPSGTANLYSAYYKLYSITGTITNGGGDGIAATLQLLDSFGNEVVGSVTAASSGAYTISNVPSGAGYTIAVTMTGYVPQTIAAFDLSGDVTGKNLTLALYAATLTSGGSTTNYDTIQHALTAAKNGDTVTVLQNTTEALVYSVTSDKTITLDGLNHTVTAPDTSGASSFALVLGGSGTIILQNITLQGGTVSPGNYTSCGLAGTSADNLTVLSGGFVTAKGGQSSYRSAGVYNGGIGTVNIDSAIGGEGQYSYGVYNACTGTVNVKTAEGGTGSTASFGIWNEGGTVNVASATSTSTNGSIFGVYNNSGCTNVTYAAGGTYDVYNYSGTLNAATVTTSAKSAADVVLNIGSNVASLTLNKGPGASCVLETIAIAASGDTTVGTLPGVLKDGVIGAWYTTSAKTTAFSGTTVSSGTSDLYSTFYTDLTAPTVSSVTPSGTSEATSGNVVITFSEDIDTAGTVTLTAGTATTLDAANGGWTNAYTYTIHYSGLSSGTAYTVGISGFKDTSANTMVTDSTHSFTTAVSDTLAPAVSSVTPSGTSEATSGNVVITFSEDIDTKGTVTLTAGTATTLDATKGSWTNAYTYTIPYSGLTMGTAYTVGITGFKDTSGNTMDSDSTHTFTTTLSFAVTTTDGAYSFDSSGNLTISASGTYLIAGLGTTLAHTITVGSGVTANITLDNVSIDVSSTTNACAFSIASGSTANLALSGKSTLKSGPNCAGLRVPVGAYLTVNSSNDSNELDATRGYYISDGGAGIGGNIDESCGTVTINGGTVVATGGRVGAAGIGAGFISGIVGKGGSGGYVTVNGGIVTAVGGDLGSGAGIGGSAGHDGGGGGGTVVIKGGTVTATGYYGGAGIGGGASGSGMGGSGATVTISGGTVTATGNGGGAGIGGGIGNSGGGSGACVITGGSVSVSSMGPTPTNGTANGSETVWITTVSLDGVSAATAVTALTTTIDYSYGMTDLYTDSSGKLYLYLPEDTQTRGARTSSHGYSGAITTTTDSATSLGTLTLDDTAPTVSTVSPSGTGATLSGNIVVSFSEAMDEATAGTVSLNGAAALTGGSWSSDAKTYTVPYSDLSKSTAYTVTISGFTDDAGNVMVDDSSHSFTTKAQTYSGGGGSSTASYTITATVGTGGSISPSGSASVTSGDDKTYTIAANEGYEISDVLIDGVSVGAVSTYTFDNVTKAHTITATFKEAETVNPFTDISENDWFYKNVIYVYENDLMNGTDSDTFNPNGTTTRGMLVTVLYRLSGDTGSYDSTFSDVVSGSWYENAAAWASVNGIASGVGDNKFAPESAVTREQLAVMLYNYAKYKGYDVSIGEDTNILSYNDALTISDYAYSALQWACGAGIIQGSNSNLNPGMSATRAEVAAMLERFIEKVTT